MLHKRLSHKERCVKVAHLSLWLCSLKGYLYKPVDFLFGLVPDGQIPYLQLIGNTRIARPTEQVYLVGDGITAFSITELS